MRLSDSDYLLAMIDETFGYVLEIKEHNRRLLAIAKRLSAIEGYVLVPKEPTEVMIDELRGAWKCSFPSDSDYSRGYMLGWNAALDKAADAFKRAMLEAAPKPQGEQP